MLLNKKAGIVIVFFFLVLFALIKPAIFALECNEQSVKNCSGNDCALLKELCTQRASEYRKQADSLLTQKQLMTTQIYLTTLKIQETEQKIISMGKEIELLGKRIEGLDQSLDYISRLLLGKIVQSYKQRETSLFSLLFSSNNTSELLSKIKYVKTLRDNNQRLLVRVQEEKSNSEEQRKRREEKKIELDTLTTTLNAQKNTLNVQKISLEKLITDSKNNDKIYTNLSSIAQQQISSFKTFSSTSGSNSIISADVLGPGLDGNYYSQRDARWANQTIGYSSENILNVGCLLSSVSMLLKKHGVDTNPSVIASTKDYFWANTAWMNYRWNISLPNGLRGYSLSRSDIDTELNNNNYVIVGIGYNSCENKGGGDHYVVLTKKDGNDYKMHDPIYGPDRSFNEHYSLICSVETIR